MSPHRVQIGSLCGYITMRFTSDGSLRRDALVNTAAGFVDRNNSTHVATIRTGLPYEPGNISGKEDIIHGYSYESENNYNGSRP